MPGIFGPTGREVFRDIQRQRGQEAAARGAQAGTMSPSQMFGQAGSFLGLALQEAGRRDQIPPEVERANKLQAAQSQVIQSGVDASDPVAFNEALAEALSAQGLVEEASMAGREAQKIAKERTEERNIQSLIESRLTVKEQERQDKLDRESREEVSKLGRESREEVSRLDRESRERLARERGARPSTAASKPRVQTAATSSDIKGVESIVLDVLGKDTLAEVENKDDLNRWVAQRAKVLTQSNPGMDFQVAQRQAATEANQSLDASRFLPFDFKGARDLRFNPPDALPASSTAASSGVAATTDVQTQADIVLGL